MNDFLNLPNNATPPNSDGANRHAKMPKPLEEASERLSSIAAESGETLPNAVKARQRAALLAHAQHLSPMSEQKTVSQEPRPKKQAALPNKWLGFSFGFAGVMAALALVIVMSNPSGFQLPGFAPVTRSLTIQAVHASDAFILVADKSDAAGVAQDSTLTITSKVDVSSEELKQSLIIDPPLDIDVQKTGDGTYQITPKNPLAPGETYRVSILTTVDKGDGTLAKREFSWALQAKNDFRVLSTIPRDGSSFVPTNTGIEFKLTRDTWTDATSSFAIVPDVVGRFEKRGRFLTFIPSRPLEEGRRFEVTLKKGFGASEGDAGLNEDVKIRFETDVASRHARPETQPLTFSIDEFQEITPNQSWTMDLGWYYSQPNSTDVLNVDVKAYRLSKDEARRLLEARLSLPDWAAIERDRYSAYEQATKTEALRTEVKVDRIDYRNQITLPKMESGFYTVRIEPKGPRAGKPTWAFVQVSDIATYMVADKDKLFVWAVNPSTNRPLTNLRTRIGSQDRRTNEGGLVELVTPAVLNVTSTKYGDVFPYELIEIGEDGFGLRFAVVRRNFDGYAFDFGNADTRITNTWGYLYLDRPLYRVSDSLKVFGVAQDRQSREGVQEVELRLRKQGYWFDWFTGNDKVYQKKTVKTDSAGRFESGFEWDQLAQGYYTVEAKRGDQTVFTSYFEVREFVKPSYALSVMLDRPNIYDGEKITGTIKAAFYEGTPVPKLKVRLTWADQNREFETDGQGLVRFELDYGMRPCAPASSKSYGCGDSDYVGLYVVPVGGEEGEVRAEQSVIVHRGEVGVDLDLRSQGLQASLTGKTWRRNLDAKDGGRSQAWGNRPVTATIIGRTWERVPDGFVYDFIEKKNVQRYRAVEVFDAPITVNLTSDAGGRLSHGFAMTPNKDFLVILDSRDDRGRLTRVSRWIWPNAFESSYGGRAAPPATDTIAERKYGRLELTPKAAEGEMIGYALDQQVTATYLVGDEPLDASRVPAVLYVIGSRGLRKAEVKNANNYGFRFEEAWMPNAEVRAVTWRDGRFEEVQNTAAFKRDEKELVIEATADQKEYVPGAKVTVNLTAKLKKTGQVVPEAKIAWGAVDKALLALSYDMTADPLASLYSYVPDGVIFSSRSHKTSYDGFGGAEMGGGGGEGARAFAQSDVRKNFKDTADFGVVTTDSQGRATITYTAPDNITGWRFEMVGVTPGLEAGAGRVDINVTKAVFVDVVAPPRVLTTDQPFLKLRAYGVGLKDGDDVTFAVKAPTLGIDQSVPGKANREVFLGIPRLVDGRHALTITVTSQKGSDALERIVTVVPSRFRKDQFVSVDAAPGTGLPDIGQAEADILLAPGNRASLQPLARGLVWTWSSRSDALLAARVALRALKNDFRVEDEWLPTEEELRTRFSTYQDESGGIRLLPYASSDIELSSEMAATAPDMLDTNSLSGYFYSFLEDKTASREVQVQALAGLAALHEPVLPSLQELSAQSDLTWREQLTVARGLASAGDLERARVLLESLLAKTETRDTVTSLKVSDKDMDNYGATADAAALAARLAHPMADQLARFVETNWERDSFPALARARYLSAKLPTLANKDIRLAYIIGGDEQVLDFKDGEVQRLTLTAQEAANFRVTSVDGPVNISFVRRVTGRPSSVPEVAISRRYEAAKPLDQSVEGDAIRVILKPEWKTSAQDGCYVVRDHLPGGWQPIVAWATAAYGLRESNWYPFLVEDGQVSFSVCKYGGLMPEISYVARVVSRGRYTAEAPLIQHETFSSIAATGQDQSIEIK